MGLFSVALIVTAFWINLGWFWGLLALVAFLIDTVLDLIIKD